MMGLFAISVLLLSAEGGRATQAPKMGLDMVTIGNGYDAGSNSMTVGTIDPGRGRPMAPRPIPPAAAGPQTALIAAAYLGEQSAASSPDTPPKVPPDDSSYAAPSGGVVATLNLQVMPGQAGQLLTMDLDDANPNSPGSKIVVFDTTGTKDIFLEESSLLDGFHAEGIPCVPPGGAGPGPSSPHAGRAGGVCRTPHPARCRRSRDAPRYPTPQ